MEQNIFFVYYYLLKPHFLKAFVVGAEKNNLNEMVLTLFVLIYLFIYLSIYSHSCICSHFFYSCASCSYALKYFCNVEKLAIYMLLSGR